MKKLVASPRSFPLFRTITRQARPSLAEIESALLVCEKLHEKLLHSTSQSLWDSLEALSLPSSQTSWLRALFMDVAGPAPLENSPHRRSEVYRTYTHRIERELRGIEKFQKISLTPPSPFSPLEELFK